MEPRKRVNASGQRQHAVDDARISEGAPKAATARSSNVNSMTGEPTAAPDSMRLSRKAARIFALLLLFRLANAFLVVTFFQPDEYFQALEPAWAMVFGKQSGAWLTWEWEHHLRSSLHPRLFAAAYWAAREATALLRLPPSWQAGILVATPRLVQAPIAVAGDFFAWKLSERIYGVESNASWVTLVMSVVNPFNWYCSVRTFSNSLETTLTAAALSFWPWELFGEPKESWAASSPPWGLRLKTSLFLASAAIVLRPTNVLIWGPIFLSLLLKLFARGMSRVAMWTMISVIKDSIFCASDVLAVSFLSDYRFYGSWTFPPARWLYFNLVQSLAVFYGRNPWHYYLSQGIPLLCIASLPWVLVGLYRAALSPTSIQTGTLGASVITTVAALSLITHKEVRFVYPLLPILQVLGAPGAAATFTERRDRSRGTDKAVSGARYGLRRVPMLATLLGLNVVLAFFLSALHQPAPVAVTTFLRHEFERVHPDRLSLTPPTTANNTEEDERFALFLTPCHSTPWRSHLVYPRLSVRALTCEPPLHTSPGTPEREGYRDEADRFYDDQLGFLRDELWSFAFVRDGSSDGRGAEQEQREKALPRYIVGFEGIEATLRAFFKQVQFAGFGEVRLRRVWEGWNGFANEDWRRRGKLVVWDTGVWDADEWGTE